MASRVTLDHIAQHIGVSKTLVSLVLNGKAQQYGISRQTCDRVFAAVKELNYRPNQTARSLRTGKTGTIGLVVSDISNTFYAQLARQFEDLATANGYSVIICSTDEDVEKEQRLITMLRNRQVDGLVVSSSQSNAEWLMAVNDGGTPLVLIDRHLGANTLTAVVAANRVGGAMLANHLFEQGYRYPLVIGLSTNHISSVAERIEGFVEVFKGKGLPYAVREVGFNTLRPDVENLLANLKLLPFKPDCLFAVNNNVATAALQSLAAMRVKIPNTLGLVCFDDLPYFSIIDPAITAVEQPIAAMCSKAFELLQIKMVGQGVDVRQEILELPVKLNVRKSSFKKS
ncbi:MAG: LacI family DNA-binding transcriptional regulator [Bacteroidota bacterium]